MQKNILNDIKGIIGTMNGMYHKKAFTHPEGMNAVCYE
ncbi:hypothetical protein B4119_0776 [Parageobacillus caldoxylosilyticus]|uniref:Uncharacterized protein n=1 Tax=Saccharococcus caldoxylosilyticus TaxID=81408 RepID=A0A150M1I4_9BACL|nr:hypothetical protein B4119_0776 [Parageobacillus caldoxylosilyticus]